MRTHSHDKFRLRFTSRNCARKNVEKKTCVPLMKGTLLNVRQVWFGLTSRGSTVSIATVLVNMTW